MQSQKELMEQANKEYGVGGSDNSFLRFEKSGDYKVRVLTAGYPLATYFYGKGVKPRIAYSEMAENLIPKDADTGEKQKPAVKFVCYVIDREDGQIKLAEMPYTVVKAITAYQEDEEYAFDDFPMPYDIKVTFDKDAAPADKYKVLASRNSSELTEEESKALADKLEKLTPEQYITKRKDKQREADSATATYEGNAQEYDNNYPEGPEEAPPF